MGARSSAAASGVWYAIRMSERRYDQLRAYIIPKYATLARAEAERKAYPAERAPQNGGIIPNIWTLLDRRLESTLPTLHAEHASLALDPGGQARQRFETLVDDPGPGLRTLAC